jgi:hypothetical protein
VASVDDRVRELISRWPCSFRNRTQALHHILVVLGSGFVWREGEADQRVPDPRDCLYFHKDWAARASTWRARRLRLSESELDATCPAEDIRSRAGDLAQARGDLGREPYPATLGSLLASVPTYVSDDWRRAAGEIAAVVVPAWTAALELGPVQGRRLAEVLECLERADLL